MEIIDSNLFSISNITTLRKEFNSNQPYPHIQFNKLFNPSFLQKVHDEVTSNITANFKETDLFKLFQTAELGSFREDEMQSKMPNLYQLRSILYDKKFRDVVQKITGCGELIDRCDCSCNAYANSCHLLCHDDVIGTRCVSYIIYFSDPEEPWEQQDGGALELFPLLKESIVNHPQAGEQGSPDSLPTKTYLPTFNTMLMFTVQPGRSYHSVQEVFSKNRPRLSISGWYHTAEPPVGSDKSSLQQILQQKNDQLNQFQPIERSISLDGDGFNSLTAENLYQLSKYISPVYLQRKSIAGITKTFINESSVLLQDFLLPDILASIQREMILADSLDRLGKGRPSLDYSAGVHSGWTLIGPPHKRRYLSFQRPLSDDASSESASHHAKMGHKVSEIAEFFRSEAFAAYLRVLTTLIVTDVANEIRRFRCGLDYTVAHYGILTKEKKLDATLCFVNDDREVEQSILRSKVGKKRKSTESETGAQQKARGIAEKKKGKAKDEEEEKEKGGGGENEEDYEEDYSIQWEDGEVGGFECFIEAEAENGEAAEAAEVYRKDQADDEGSLLSVSASCNALSLVLRDEGIMKFVKYVSANAPGSRWDLAVEYNIQPNGSDDDSDDDSEAEESSETAEDDEAETEGEGEIEEEN